MLPEKEHTEKYLSVYQIAASPRITTNILNLYL